MVSKAEARGSYLRVIHACMSNPNPGVDLNDIRLVAVNLALALYRGGTVHEVAQFLHEVAQFLMDCGLMDEQGNPVEPTGFTGREA